MKEIIPGVLQDLLIICWRELDKSWKEGIGQELEGRKLRVGQNPDKISITDMTGQRTRPWENITDMTYDRPFENRWEKGQRIT